MSHRAWLALWLLAVACTFPASRGRAQDASGATEASVPPPPVATDSTYASPTSPYTSSTYAAPSTLAESARGDSLEDRATAGEVIDLMVTLGGWGVLGGNAVVAWSDADRSGSTDDDVRVHFIASFVGATLSLTGLLGQDAPRGVPTSMAIGTRYGVFLAGLGVVGFGRWPTDDATLGVMLLGGALGFGAGAALGYGLRPHPARSRFVEAGGLWGGALGMLLTSMADSPGQDVWVGATLGVAGGLGVHALVAALVSVSAGRGWLLNAAFAGGAGLGALFTWGIASGASGPTYAGVAGATGLIALGVVFALTDRMQDAGWVEDAASVQLGVAPLEGGGLATVSGVL